MTKIPEYDQVFTFENLYAAHLAARKGKRHKAEVIAFEMHLAENLIRLHQALQNRSYRQQGYYSFMVYEPKERLIHAPYYADRVVQHCLCDNLLRPALEPRLIYDNAACRKDKGTHFAMRRLTGFLTDFYRKHGTEGYFLKCDIQKYFNHIAHAILKEKLEKVFREPDTAHLLCQMIDSYAHDVQTGLPLGNQTSQWFALYYLDSVDRLVKERLQIQYYTRYMDDFILIHQSKKHLRHCLREMRQHCAVLGLTLNQKTQIFPLRNGVAYLGWQYYLTKSGKVLRKLRTPGKHRTRHRMRGLQSDYAAGRINMDTVKRSIVSLDGHLQHGHTHRLRGQLIGRVGFART
ncbi:MAG: RNA-directed DNA polymerase [Oscillospiraceae bacterium]|jgi:hypothetical protein|nr:RNA-directed DNA polymerase [Oscillospiraceae bacterium]